VQRAAFSGGVGSGGTTGSSRWHKVWAHGRARTREAVHQHLVLEQLLGGGAKLGGQLDDRLRFGASGDGGEHCCFFGNKVGCEVFDAHGTQAKRMHHPKSGRIRSEGQHREHSGGSPSSTHRVSGGKDGRASLGGIEGGDEARRVGDLGKQQVVGAEQGLRGLPGWRVERCGVTRGRGAGALPALLRVPSCNAGSS